MLVFRRKIGEAVVLDGRIEVQVLDITGNRVKLGFSAPPDVIVTRKEIVLTRDENRRAAELHSSESLSRLVTALRMLTPPEEPPNGLPGAGSGDPAGGPSAAPPNSPGK